MHTLESKASFWLNLLIGAVLVIFCYVHIRSQEAADLVSMAGSHCPH